MAVHWKRLRKSNPELFSLAHERAAVLYPELLDPRDAPADLNLTFGTRKARLSLRTIDRRTEELFAHGYCTLLALALHEQSGLPLALLTDSQTANHWGGHAFVMLPDSSCLDITGVNSLPSIQERYGLSIEPEILSPKEFSSRVATGPEAENIFLAVAKLEELYTRELASHLLKVHRKEIARRSQ